MPRGHLGSYRESKSAIAKIVTKNECLLSLRLAGLSDSIHFDSILVTRQKPGFLRAERNRWLGLVTNKPPKSLRVFESVSEKLEVGLGTGREFPRRSGLVAISFREPRHVAGWS